MLFFLAPFCFLGPSINLCLPIAYLCVVFIMAEFSLGNISCLDEVQDVSWVAPLPLVPGEARSPASEGLLPLEWVSPVTVLAIAAGLLQLVEEWCAFEVDKGFLSVEYQSQWGF